MMGVGHVGLEVKVAPVDFASRMFAPADDQRLLGVEVHLSTLVVAPRAEAAEATQCVTASTDGKEDAEQRNVESGHVVLAVAVLVISAGK
jgi:hypothetical protein